MIAIIAAVHAKAGKEQELLGVLKELVAETRKESGCMQYDLHVAIDNPGAFAFYERWTERIAIDAHLKTSHIARAFSRFTELADGEPVITLCTLVE